MTSDLALLDLSEVADLIAAKKVSSVEATEACLARIETWQPRTNAFLRLDRDGALKQARAMDAELARGKRRSPLHGVPLAHKDLYYRKGEISTAGGAIRRDWRAPHTATALARLDHAGAVELGFLNMAEFAAGPTGHNVHYGHCRNPWDATRVTGGSSSGSGAAVAARMTYGSLGSDTGGSIRLPAAACGVVGMKATYGRVSRHGAAARSWTLDHVGPLTRSVRDNARMLAAIAGTDENDSTASAVPVPDYEAELNAGIKGLRIGLSLPEALVPVDPQVGAAVEAAAAALSKLGAQVTTAKMPDFTALYRAAEVIVKSEAASMHRPWMEHRPQDYANQVRTRMEAGFFIPATQYIDALRLRGHFVREFLDTAMPDGVDAVMLPGIPFPIPTIAETDTEKTGGPSTLAMVARFTGLTRPFNTLGLPALSMPCGFDSNGLPIAYQLIGRPFAEGLLYRIGHAYQGATEFHKKVPQ